MRSSPQPTALMSHNYTKADAAPPLTCVQLHFANRAYGPSITHLFPGPATNTLLSGI